MKRVVHHAKKHARKLKELRVINNCLTVVAVLLALYIILAPFLPSAKWVVTENSPLKGVLSKAEAVEKEAGGTIGSNRLFIPRIGLEEFIFEGGAESLHKGVVRRGHTSTPDQGSNTVLVGHRFMYDQKGVFYLLDKVEVGDPITLHWDRHAYEYRVTEVFVVPPEQVSIEDATDDKILTIYTCTPLWSAKNRLVVRAALQEQQ